MLRTIASPAQSPVRWRSETRRRAATAPAVTPTAITGTHQGTPSGAISVNEKIATSATSTVMIGTSAAINAGTRGALSGATRRSEAIRAAIPNDPFTTLAT